MEQKDKQPEGAKTARASFQDEIERIVRGEDSDASQVLGPHWVERDGKRVLMIRAFRPSATEASQLWRGNAVPQAMTQIHPDGVFEAVAPSGAGVVSKGDEGAASDSTLLREGDALAPNAYRLRFRFADGNTWEDYDPYAFPPLLTDYDLYLSGEGTHYLKYEKQGAHVREIHGVLGVHFAVWAPNAQRVSVVGDFNFWDGRVHTMRNRGASGIWELFIPGLGEGALYKFEIRSRYGNVVRLKADPYGFAAELRPKSASVVCNIDNYEWKDAEWMKDRAERDWQHSPMTVYELHAGSWRRKTSEGNRWLTYRELAEELIPYVKRLGYTHIELMPIMEHPFDGSCGYQTVGYYAVTRRYGSPADFMYFVDCCHREGIGVFLDWTPAHFPRDAHGLSFFDGTHLYEHADPRRGAHPDWGTLVFNFGRHEVRNFLIANALFWLREYHVDGIRVDAVASMLYLDYSRREGEWVPNQFGGREDLDAVAFLKELNEVIYADVPGVISAAEESTAWPGVSRPTYLGGLGFGFKWNMGWMHDTLAYFEQDPIYRRFHHHELTFSLMYAFSENFVLPLSHDEVVHGKGSLYTKMAGGDHWQKLANLRALYAYMWAHPGKKLLFMGQEFAQIAEWSHERSLDWHLLEQPAHSGMQALIRDLNTAYRAEPALYELDSDPAGFWWLEPNDADNNVLAFARRSADGNRVVVFVANLSPVPRYGYRLGLPKATRWRELVNTDSSFYGGSDVGNLGGVAPEPIPWHEQPGSAELTLPPLAAIWLVSQG